MPGLVDTHIHALRGALTALGLAFPVTSSVDEIKAAVKQYIADKKLKKGEWVEGAKWEHDYYKLNTKMLDEVAPGNPVFLHDWTNHLAWVNSAALEAANITKDTPDPQGGVIDRDSAGNPTGTLHDKALGLITAAMPPPKPEVVEMIDAYVTAPTFGTPSIDESTFSTWMLRFDTEGLKVMAHATGRLSVRHFLNAVEAVRRANGKGPRHHMAHSMLVYPDEVDRFDFERSNFVAEVSPYQLWTPDPAIRSRPKIITSELSRPAKRVRLE